MDQKGKKFARLTARTIKGQDVWTLRGGYYGRGKVLERFVTDNAQDALEFARRVCQQQDRTLIFPRYESWP